jgi:hypothetical protein
MRHMKNFVLAAAALAVLFGAAPAARAEVETSGEAALSIMSNYVWRGLRLSDDWVAQPTVGITYGGFGANLWANYDGDSKEMIETDLTLNYTLSVGDVGLDFGYIYYSLDGLEDTQELYASVSYEWLVSPWATLYYDYDVGTGAFLAVGADYGLDLTDSVSFSAGASASYVFDNNVVGVDSDGEEYSDLHNGEVYASVSIAVTDAVSIEPMLAYSFALSNDAEDGIAQYSFDGEEDTFYGGVTVGLSF